MRFSFSIILFFFFIHSFVHATGLKSSTGRIVFDVDNSGFQDGRMNRTGLRLGSGNAQEKLDVAGNGIVEQSLSIGRASSPSSNLSLSGTMDVSYQMISSNTSVLTSSYIFANSSNQDIVIDLPDPSLADGRLYRIKKMSASNNVTITSNTYIDDIDTQSLSIESGTGLVEVLSQGNAWYTFDTSGTITTNWTPLSLGNLLGWYDAHDSSTMTFSGNEVSDLQDKGPLGQHATDDGASKYPEYYQRTINGRPALDFQGEDLLLDDSFSSSGSGNISLFLLAMPEEGSEFNYSSILALNSDEVGDNDFQFAVGSAGNFLAQISVNNVGGGIGNSGTNFVNEIHLFEIIFDVDNDNTYRYIDGSLEASNLGGYTGVLDQGMKLRIMANRGKTGETNGIFGELIICEDIDASSRQKIEGYLMWKWGLEDDLPSSHPYKGTPPR